MATKRYNHKDFDFTVNGERINFYCWTTDTKNGFCHHVWAVGGGKDYEHTRVSYFNRTWETFEYETALKSAVAKFRKVFSCSFAPGASGYFFKRRRKSGKIHPGF